MDIVIEKSRLDMLLKAEAECASLRAELEKVKGERETLKRIMADLVVLAGVAMEEANHDGAEYDVVAELAEARAAITPVSGDPAGPAGEGR